MPSPALEVVNIAGFKGAGKTTACRYLERYYGASIFDPLGLVNSFSDHPVERPTQYNQVQSEMLVTNPNAYLDAILQSTGRVCIDGLLVVDQAKRLKRELGIDYYTVALDCHPLLRARNLHKSPKNDYDIYANQDVLEVDETPLPGENRFKTDVQGVMDMYTQNGWLLDTGKSLPSVKLQLDNIASALSWARQQG
jgi:hypothetical protein